MLEDRIRDLLVGARADARRQGLDAEFLFHRERSGLVRLGNSAVSLATSEELSRLDVSVQDGRKIGQFGLNADIRSAGQLSDALSRALESCREALPKDYNPLFGAVEEGVDDSTGFDPALENLSPETKIDFCAGIIRAIGSRGDYDFSGSWSTGSTEVYYISTANDREAYRRLTDGKLVLVLKSRKARWELEVERSQKKALDISPAGMIEELQRFIPLYEGNGGYRAPVGRQRVLFGPHAAAELVFLSRWGGFLGRAWEEGRAFTAGMKPGDTLFSDLVTIADDPANPDVFSMPFDFNGRRRRRFLMVEKGVFRGLLYDSTTAARYGKKPTGHDLASLDLELATGDGKPGLEEAADFAGEALYIPHLHYVGMPDPAKGVFTGSSRFNALRVAGGRFVAPLVSTRITDTLPSVLSHVTAISRVSVSQNQSSTYDRRSPEAYSVPEWLLCDEVRISDVAESF